MENFNEQSGSMNSHQGETKESKVLTRVFEDRPVKKLTRVFEDRPAKELTKVFEDRPNEIFTETPTLSYGQNNHLPATSQNNYTVSPGSKYAQFVSIPQQDILTNKPKELTKSIQQNYTQPDSTVNQNNHIYPVTQQNNNPTQLVSPSNNYITSDKNQQYSPMLKSKKKNPYEVAIELIKCCNFARFEDDLYVFKNNHYQKCTQEELEQLVYVMIFKNPNFEGSSYTFFRNVFKFVSHEAKLTRFNLRDFSDMKYYIGFRNGYLDLRNFMFYPPTPDRFITNYLEVDFDPYVLNLRGKGLEHIQHYLKAIACPYFDKFIWTMANANHDIFDRIFQSIGYILSNDNEAKKLFVFAGAKDSGKSRLCKFIKNLFNEDATIAISLGELGARFSRGELKGKSLCMDADLEDIEISSKLASVIKSLTGGDLTSSDVKFQSRTKFTNRAKLLFATNHSIKMHDKEDALKNRFLCIPIEKSIHPDHQISDILNLFEPEKFGIVVKSIGYYIELVNNKYQFSGDFQINNNIYFKRIVDIGKSKKDTVEDFVNQECLFTNFDEYISTDVLHEAYCNFCNNSGTYMLDLNNFSRLLKQICSDKVEHKKRRVKGVENPVSTYNGIVLKKTNSTTF